MNADGSHVEAVSPRDVRAIHPSWSIDGTQLAYCTEDDLKPPKKNPSEIDVVDLKTKKVRTLLAGGVNTYPA
jgi:Tol biopolymer transport system component